jgi:subtilisin
VETDAFTAGDCAGTEPGCAGLARQSSPRDRTPYGIETVYGNAELEEATGSGGIDIAVLDTGLDRDHPDLQRRVELCRDYTRTPRVDGECPDDSGHGTHVAGTALADGGPEGEGIYGVAPDADLYAFKVCTGSGCGSSAISAAMRDAANEGAEIIVISLGGRSLPFVQAAIDDATDEGALVVAMAGNEGPELGTMTYPAADGRVVGTGAVAGDTGDGRPIGRREYRVPNFSSRGTDAEEFREQDEYLEAAAPGRNVLSTVPGGEYGFKSGASMSAPHVAGVAAKVWQSVQDSDGNGRKNDDVRRFLRERAVELDVTEGEHARPGYDPAAGVGIPTIPQPSAAMTHAPTTPAVGETVRFDASDSTAPEGDETVGYEWDIGANGEVDAGGERTRVTFDSGGNHTIRLRVITRTGAADVVTRTVTVTAPPEPEFAVSSEVPLRGETVTLDASSTTDPDGSVERYGWDLDGDGETDTRGQQVSTAFERVGENEVTLRVTDDDGRTATVTRTLLVNDEPEITVETPPAGANEPVTLRAEVTDDVGEVTVEWEFHDGETATGRSVTRTFPAGEYELRATATDEYGAQASTVVTLTVYMTPLSPTPTPPEGTATRPPGTATTETTPGFGPPGVLLALAAVVAARFAARRNR